VASELAVMSQPDKPVGRKKVLTPTPVSSWALERGVTLFRPGDHDGVLHAVSEFSPDLGITVAYGRLLTSEVLAIPTAGWWNVHFSLLPRWRGAAPVAHALLAGDSDTGVSVFQLDDGMDTGPLLAQRSHPIAPGITAGQLLEQLSHLGAELLTDTLQEFLTGKVTPAPQHGHATNAPKPDRDTGRIRSSDAADMALRRFQATTPEPGCFVSWSHGEKTLRVLAASVSTDASSGTEGSIHNTPHGVGIQLTGGSLLLETVQPSGKTPMPAADWWRGVHEDITIDG
jgi:methionyl-tRNA formyltransferase